MRFDPKKNENNELTWMRNYNIKKFDGGQIEGNANLSFSLLISFVVTNLNALYYDLSYFKFCVVMQNIFNTLIPLTYVSSDLSNILYPLPPNIENLVKFDAFKHLDAKLTRTNYRQRLHTLLYVEEYQRRANLQRY